LFMDAEAAHDWLVNEPIARLNCFLMLNL